MSHFQDAYSASPMAGLSIDRRIAAELTESAISRYPGTDGPDVESTRALVGEARRVFGWTRDHLRGVLDRA